MKSGIGLLKKELEQVDDSLFEIDEANLVEAFARQAAIYTHFSKLTSLAEEVLAVADNEKDIEYAAADEVYRTEKESAGEKYTEAVIRSLVIRDEVYQEAVEAYNTAHRIYQTYRGILKALDMRASMLISMGAMLRQEQEMTGMSIRERSFKEALEEARSKVAESASS